MGGGRPAMIRGGRQGPAAAYHAEAAEVLRFVEALPDMVREGERNIGERAAALLAAFERRIVESGAPVAAGPPARYALAVLIDARARAERGLRMSVWTATAHAKLFDGRDMSVDRIRRFRDTAARQGPAFAPLQAFLSDILGEHETARTTREKGLACADGASRRGKRRAGPVARRLCGLPRLALSREGLRSLPR